MEVFGHDGTPSSASVIGDGSKAEQVTSCGTIRPCPDTQTHPLDGPGAAHQSTFHAQSD